MADGRHFANGFIAISQPEIIRFHGIWYADAWPFTQYNGGCKLRLNQAGGISGGGIWKTTV